MGYFVGKNMRNLPASQATMLRLLGFISIFIGFFWGSGRLYNEKESVHHGGISGSTNWGRGTGISQKRPGIYKALSLGLCQRLPARPGSGWAQQVSVWFSIDSVGASNLTPLKSQFPQQENEIGIITLQRCCELLY